MPTLRYRIEVRCLNCKHHQTTTVRKGCRWVNASDAQIGSGYYKQNDPTKKVKKTCENCGCDALKWQGNILRSEGDTHEVKD